MASQYNNDSKFEFYTEPVQQGDVLRISINNIFDGFADEGQLEAIGMMLIETPGCDESRIHYPVVKSTQHQGNFLRKIGKSLSPSPALSLLQQLRQTMNQSHAEDLMVLFISVTENLPDAEGSMYHYFRNWFYDNKVPFFLVTPKTREIVPHLVLGTLSLEVRQPNPDILSCFRSSHGITNAEDQASPLRETAAQKKVAAWED